MDFSTENPANDSFAQLINGSEFLKNFEKDGYSIVKYRDIPVDKVLEMLKTSGIYRENAYGGKEVRKMDPSKRNIEYQSDVSSVCDSELLTNISEQPSRSLNIPAKVITRGQCDAQLDVFSQDRTGQGSVSEPTLSLAKDRGDILQDISTEDSFTANECFGNGKNLMENQDIKGCIYIKHAGKVFKAVIEAKSVESENDGSSSITPDDRKKSSTSGSIPNNKLKDDVFERSSFTFSTDEYGDFDIAIFLSGLKFPSSKIQPKQGISESKYELIKSRREKSKLKRKIAKTTKSSNASVGQMYEIVQENHLVPSKSHNAFQNGRSKSSRPVSSTFRIRKSETKVDLSSDESDSNIFLVNEDGSKQKLKQIKENRCISVKPDDENQENQAVHYNYSFSRNETLSQRSGITSQSSMSHYSSAHGVPKSKITDGDLWEHFEKLFKNYASTSLHSGEVIPRKTSTEWMIDAGVIDELLTQKEADEAFKSAVGVKITMNAQEYKDFLIMLTIRMKLPYYEIYRRMCGV